MNEPGPGNPGFAFDETARPVVEAALEAALPGCVALGALDYVEGLLGALDHDPPHIWAAPADSGADWLELGAWERFAWQRRIDEWRSGYERVVRGDADDADRRVVYEHACEATYGDPAYGGNRNGGGWTRIDFPEPLFPPSRAHLGDADRQEAAR